MPFMLRIIELRILFAYYCCIERFDVFCVTLSVSVVTAHSFAECVHMCAVFHKYFNTSHALQWSMLLVFGKKTIYKM